MIILVKKTDHLVTNSVMESNYNFDLIGTLHHLSWEVFQKINFCFCFTGFLQSVLFVCVFLLALLFLGWGATYFLWMHLLSHLQVISVDWAPPPGVPRWSVYSLPSLLPWATIHLDGKYSSALQRRHFWWLTLGRTQELTCACSKGLSPATCRSPPHALHTWKAVVPHHPGLPP